MSSRRKADGIDTKKINKYDRQISVLSSEPPAHLNCRRLPAHANYSQKERKLNADRSIIIGSARSGATPVPAARRKAAHSKKLIAFSKCDCP